jgi:hypothetical protein
MAKPKRKWPVIAGVAFILAFLAAMAYSTFGNRGFRCEVCMTFNGQTICRNGAGPTQEAAERGARDGACTDLTHSMTELVRCQSSEAKVSWK